MNGTQVTPGGGGARADNSDRATAAIRPVDPAQQAALSDFFAALSVETRYRRFFAPVRPTHGLLDLLSGRPANVDAIVAVAGGHKHVGMGARACQDAQHGLAGRRGTGEEPQVAGTWRQASEELADAVVIGDARPSYRKILDALCAHLSSPHEPSFHQTC